ncbi:MAG TPA: hypothetical protein VMV19_04070 [Xanthobacteraceae bacterium]|nr:hypothetical protein [Xanthobacteraceae bacterium]
MRSSAPLAADLRNRQRLRFKHRKVRANNYCEPIIRRYIGEANESAIKLVSKMPACAPAGVHVAAAWMSRANNGDQITVTASAKKTANT